MGNGLLHSVEGALNVQVVGAVPQVIVDLQKLGAFDGRARTVKQEINLSVYFDGLGDHVLNACSIGHIHMDAAGHAAGVLSLARGSYGALLVYIGANDVRPLAPEDRRC